MNDLIRRIDAISALGEEPEVWFDDDNGDFDRGMKFQWKLDVDALKAVPPAEPRKILFGSGIKYSGTSNLPSAYPMPDGFDPEHLTEEDKRDIAEALDYLKDTLEACTESQRESVQEIIRCKDCKKYSEKTHCIMWSDDINEFCSRAERKEDE